MKIITNKEYEIIKLKQDNNKLYIQELEKRIEEISGANKGYKLENRRLRKKINKAIEYIEKNVVCELGETCEPFISVPKLLNILRGEDNEND